MAKNTILVKSYVDNREEFIAAAALTPGHLVEIATTGKVQKHSTASGNAAARFALEDDLQGNGVGDAYSAGNVVQTKLFVPGEKVLARLKDGENVAIGNLLESAGDGTLQKYVADYASKTEIIYPKQIVGIAREALDLSSSSGADTTYLLLVEII